MLPLFPGKRLPVVQTVQPTERSSACTRCELHTLTPAGQRCIAPEGTPGDILVIGEYPGEFERRLGRPLADGSGQALRAIFESVAPGRNVVYSLALGCKPTFKRKPDGDLVPEQDLPTCIEACRPYLHQDIVDSEAKVIFLVGPLAGMSTLGETYRALSVRTGYGWFYSDGPKPVFFLPDPSYALSNRLVRMALEQDIATALQNPPSARLLDAQYSVVTTTEEARKALLECRKAPYIATDVETSGMMFEADFRIECVAVAIENWTWVFPREYCEKDADLLEALVDILHTCDNTSWNGQYDYTAFECDKLFKSVALRRYWDVSDPAVMNLQSDARIKRKLLEADAAADLATAANLIGMGGHKQEAHTVLAAICDELRKYRMSFQKTPTGKTRKPAVLNHIKPAELSQATWDKWFEYLDAGFDEEKFAYRFMPKEILWRYCARDAFTTWHLEDWCNTRLILDPGLALLWEEVSKPAMWAYCEMRMNGMPLDKGGLQLFAQYLETEIKQVQAKIDGYKPGLNPVSPKQVGEYLLSLGIVPKKKTATGQPSYSDDALEDFKNKHPIVDLILQHRELTKQLGTYAVGYGHFVRSDGYVHPSYLADGTESGRASSQDPNLFNVSKGRTERKKKLADMLRACFKCPPGWEIVEVDAGQIEIRGAAHLSADPDMHAMLTSGTDFHMASAKKFASAVGKDPEKVTDLDREAAKTCIAAGQLVLTHRGLVPIENIGGCDLLWDGVEWVSHDGLLPMGRQKVITYDGLTATPDHRVYLDDGTACPLSEVGASGRCLAISGVGNLPIRDAFSHWENYDSQYASKAQACRVPVLCLSQDVSDACLEYQERTDEELPMSEAFSVRARSSRDDYRETVHSNALSLHGFEQSDVQELRTTRDRVQICVSGGVHPLGLGKPAASDVPKCGHRQDRQLRTLRAGEPASCVSQRECLQHTSNEACHVPGPVYSPVPRLASDEDRSPQADLRARIHQQASVSGLDSGGDTTTNSCGWAEVYDIANAGPRHRFTVSDRLVSNCNFAAIYEIPSELGGMLAGRLGIPNKDGEALAVSMFQTYVRLRAWMEEQYSAAWEVGYSRTYWKGLPARRRPLWGLGRNPSTLSGLEKGIKKDRDNRKRYDLNAARSTYNGPVQGSSVDVIASHLWETVLWLRANTEGGKLILQVYDSIMVMVKTADVEKTVQFLKSAMTQPLFGNTPLTADAKRGPSWGSMTKIK